MAEAKNKLYRVIAMNLDDSINGVHYCTVQATNYAIKLNQPVELPDPVKSYLENGLIYKTPGIDLTDETSYVDVRKGKQYETIVSKRFEVIEV